MQFLHNPFDKDVDLNTILYRITYPEYFEDSEFADEEEPEVDEVIFGRDQYLEAKLTWSYGVDCWRVIYAELAQAKEQVQQQIIESGKATEESIELQNALQTKLDLCLSAKSDLESAAEDARLGKPIDFLILAEKSLPPGSKIYYRKASVSDWSSIKFGIPIPEWSSSSILSKPPTRKSTSHATVDNPDRGWADVSIRLLPKDQISYSIAGDKWTTKPLSETGLVDKRISGEVKTNQSFELLVCLSQGLNFGAGTIASGKDKGRRHKLSKALVDLVGLQGNPFTDRSPREGYKAHFSVEDRRSGATDRAERDYTHEEYDEDRM
jgi:hypothetical protein